MMADYLSNTFMPITKLNNVFRASASQVVEAEEVDEHDGRERDVGRDEEAEENGDDDVGGVAGAEGDGEGDDAAAQDGLGGKSIDFFPPENWPEKWPESQICY